MSRLEDGMCAPCLGRLGREFARLVVRVRHEPEFALACYRALDRRRQAAFILRFGDPTLEVAPTELGRVEARWEQRSQEAFTLRFSEPTPAVARAEPARRECDPEPDDDR